MKLKLKHKSKLKAAPNRAQAQWRAKGIVKNIEEFTLHYASVLTPLEAQTFNSTIDQLNELTLCKIYTKGGEE